MKKRLALVAGMLFAAIGLLRLAAESAAAAAAVAVPPPLNPLPPLPLPPVQAIVQPLGRPDVPEIERLTPRVEIWRAPGQRPQIPGGRGKKKTDSALRTGTEPVTVRLRFDPRVAGQRVVVIAGNGFSFSPPQ